MNLLHLKYAVVIAETNSMTKAAEKLFTAQPNLSRAIKELESTLGISIFYRTSKGIFPTPEGDEFLNFARAILLQVDEIESMYKRGKKEMCSFSITAPPANYIACAFVDFISNLEMTENAEIFYHEADPLRVINNISDSDYRLGILRYQLDDDAKFKELLHEKNMDFEIVYDFEYVLLMSQDNPLANKEKIGLLDLLPYTEIVHADPGIASMPLSTVRRSNEVPSGVGKHVYIFDRSSQMDLLSVSSSTFMWVSPAPKKITEKYNLVQRKCCEYDKKYRDLLIYKQGYRLTKTDKLFVDQLIKFKREAEHLNLT